MTSYLASSRASAPVSRMRATSWTVTRRVEGAVGSRLFSAASSRCHGVLQVLSPALPPRGCPQGSRYPRALRNSLACCGALGEIYRRRSVSTVNDPYGPLPARCVPSCGGTPSSSPSGSICQEEASQANGLSAFLMQSQGVAMGPWSLATCVYSRHPTTIETWAATEQ
jgi:hypothetical protein